MEPLPPLTQQEPGLQVHSAQRRKAARGTVWGLGEGSVQDGTTEECIQRLGEL